MNHYIVPRTFAFLFVCLLLPLVATAQAQQRSIDDFFNGFTAEWVRMNPDLATQTRYFTGPEQEALEAQLTPQSREWRESRVALAKQGLAELGAFDRMRLTESQRVSADLMRWQLDTAVEGEQYQDYAFPLEQFAGANVSLVNTLTIVHPLNSENDAVHYVSRLGQVATRMGEATAEAKELSAKGMLPPRFILEATLTQMRQFVGLPPAQNPLVASFAERMSTITAMAGGRREALRAEAERITTSQVYPAWREAIAALEPLVARSTNDAGLWRLKGGDAAYAFQLRRYTNTDLTADQVHEIGLREVARIEGEMDTILKRLGRTTGSVQARVDQLEKDLSYPLDEGGRTLIMSDIDRFIGDAQERSKSLFNRVPKAAVVARPYPRFREASAAASYSAPPRDGSRPGVFQMPLRPSNMTRFGLRTLVYHETVPGHHFQIALEGENDTNPRFRQVRAFGGISAFGEGWGLYAERLARENGWYEGDLEGELGQLDAALFRARRLVVDTGLHAKRWTRQQAIDYGIEASEVERYVVLPGQACSYMIGQIKIVEMRDRVQKALGNRYSPKAFHDFVLLTGTLPLTLLEQRVDAFIAANK